MVTRKSNFIILAILLLLFQIIITQTSSSIGEAASSTPVFKPIPAQDTYKGRNSNAYLPSTTGLNDASRDLFITQLANYSVDANKKWGIPASVIIGMAALESGYGTTKIAYYANNLFGIKVWGSNPANAWQLVGQPNEDFERTIPVIADYGPDRKVYNESVRRDNWYRMFGSHQEAIDYLAGTLLQNKRYGFARDAYQTRIEKGWAYDKAAKRYLYDIAEAGYNHLGGDYYRNTVGGILDQWDLYQYDALANDSLFKDIQRHWAKEEIEHLAERGILSGFQDRTFQPEGHVTREQYVKMLVEVTKAPLVEGNTFQDVGSHRWSLPYIEAAVKQKIISPAEYGLNFRPTQAISRQEMAVLAARSLSLEPIQYPFTFKDKDAIDNRIGLVGAAVHHHIFVGFEDNTFRPFEKSTRAQAAIILTRLLNARAPMGQ